MGWFPYYFKAFMLDEWEVRSYAIELHVLRARPLTLHLHLHFYIRDADADAGKCPTEPSITQMWMKKFPRGAELPAFPRFMQGACYQLKTNNFIDVLEIIGWGLTG
jgi:hypothetical protein